MLPLMADPAEPAPRKFALKPKEFERVNAPRPESGEEPAAPPAANDVYALREELRAREIAAGMDELKPNGQPDTQRRRRDYRFLLVAGNAAIVGTAAFVGLNPMTAVFAFSGVIIYTVGLTWVMWFVMGKY